MTGQTLEDRILEQRMQRLENQRTTWTTKINALAGQTRPALNRNAYWPSVTQRLFVVKLSSKSLEPKNETQNNSIKFGQSSLANSAANRLRPPNDIHPLGS